MKDEFVKRYNENLVKAVKADLDGRTRDADYLFGNAAGMLTSAYIMYDVFGTEILARMSRASGLAYNIVCGVVEDEQESLRILENDMA